MSSVTIDDICVILQFSNDSGDSRDREESFNPADSSLQSTIEDCGEEFGGGDNWDFDDFEVCDFDDDFVAPNDFTDLDAYGTYVENVEKHGIAYHLRYKDVGDHDFEDSYNSCWHDAEEFATQLINDFNDISKHLAPYIDYEKWTRDIMMDYSEYEWDDKVYIFRD